MDGGRGEATVVHVATEVAGWVEGRSRPIMISDAVCLLRMVVVRRCCLVRVSVCVCLVRRMIGVAADGGGRSGDATYQTLQLVVR